MIPCPRCKQPHPSAEGFCNGCSLYLGTLGRYRLVELVKEGGFGAVYRGINICTGYPVAIKILHKRLVQREVFRRRFVREARILEQIQHPHVVRIFEHGIHEKLGLYLVMEWLEGQDLSLFLPSQKGELTRLRVLSLFAQLLDGLRRIHEEKVVHRDLKPQNLRVTQEGGREVLKILDFGIAWADTCEHLTQTGMSMGTPHFMAPEQIDGKYREIGPHTDLYAAGMILAWMLTGRYLFDGESPQEICFKQCYLEPPTLQQLRPRAMFPEALETLVAKAIQKDKQTRFQSADEFLTELHRALPLDSSEMQVFWGQEHEPKAFSVTEAIQAAKGCITLAEALPFSMELEFHSLTPSESGETQDSENSEGSNLQEDAEPTKKLSLKEEKDSPHPTNSSRDLPSAEEHKFRTPVLSSEAFAETFESSDNMEDVGGAESLPKWEETPLATPQSSFRWNETPIQIEKPDSVPTPTLPPPNSYSEASLPHKATEDSEQARRWMFASMILLVVLVVGGGGWIWRSLQNGSLSKPHTTTSSPTSTQKLLARKHPIAPAKRAKRQRFGTQKQALSTQKVSSQGSAHASQNIVILRTNPSSPTGTAPSPSPLPKRSSAEGKRRNARSQFLLATLSEGDGRYDEAIEFYQKVLEFQPNHAITHFRLGRLLMKSSNCLEQRMPLEIPPCRNAVKHFRIYLQYRLPSESQYTAVSRRYIKRLTQVSLRLSTVPAGAAVYQDKQLIGQTPLRIWRKWKQPLQLRILRRGLSILPPFLGSPRK